MKKLIYCALALAAGLFAASCQQENLEPVQEGNTVTFTVEIPEMATKAGAVGDNANMINDLVYAVYVTEAESLEEAQGDWDGTKTKLLYAFNSESKRFENGTDVISLELLNNQNHIVLLWAQNADTWVEEKGSEINLRNITYPSGMKLNAENADKYAAFYAVKFIPSTERVNNGKIELIRPFAQINIATADPGKYDVKVEKTVVTVNGAGDAFDVAKEQAADNADVTYEWTGKVYTNAFTVAGNDYDHYIAMNYVFANGAVEVSYTIDTDYGKGINNTISNVPVKKNFRTNIVGNLLTSDVSYDIVLDKEFNNPENVIGEEWTQTGEYTYTILEGASALALNEVLAHANSEAKAAATKSEGPVVTINLEGDVVWETGAGIGSTPLLPAESLISKVIINGNGKTFTATGKGVGQIRLANGALLTFNKVKVVDLSVSYAENSWEYGYLEFGGNLAFNECQFVNAIMMESENAAFTNCSFNSNKDNEYAVWVNEGNTTFNGCTFTGARGLKVHEAYGSEVTSVVVDGCTFGPLTTKPGIALGDLNAQTSVTIKNSTFDGCQAGDQKLYMYETDTDVTSFNFCRENNTVIPASNADSYLTQDDGSLIATSVKGIHDATKVKNATVYVYPCTENEDGVYLLEGKLSLAEGVRLIGVGDEPVKVKNDWGSNLFSNQAHFTNTYIENIYSNDNLTIDAGIINGDVVFKKCVFGGYNVAHQGVHFDSGQGTITFDECRFIGRNMFGSSIEMVTFNNCYFENKRSSLTGADKWTGVNMWGKYEFNNCTFDTEAHCNVKTDGIEADFNDCKFVDNRDITSLIWNGNGHTAKITFDGNKYIAEGLMEDPNGNAIASSQAGLLNALKSGAKNISLKAGYYELANSTEFVIASDEMVTIKGEDKEDCIVTIGAQLRADNKKLTLNNLTTNVPTGLNYTEHSFAWIHHFNQFNMIDCNSNGRIRLNCYNANIERCNFNVTTASGFDGYAIFYYGPTNSNVTVKNSAFTTVGKAIVMYNEGTPVLNLDVEDCTFKSTAETDKAAIQMHTEWGISGTLDIVNCTAEGFANVNGGLWNELNNNTKVPTNNFKVTINGKTAVSSNEALKAAIAGGATEVTLMDGDYDFTEVGNLQNKTLTLVGSKNVVINVTEVDARNQFVTGATLQFEGVTLNFGKANYMGFANTASLTYKNCDINGLQFLFGPQVAFEGCTLNSNGAEHSVWTYGAQNVTFTDCDFTYGDRCVNCYSDNDGGKQTVNFTDCTFATSNTASEGAVEINSCFFSVGIEVNLDGCTAPAYGQMAYVSPWDSTNGAKTTINIK